VNDAPGVARAPFDERTAGVGPDPEAGPSAARIADAAEHHRYGGRLFRKYLLLILSLVTIALLASGAISIYFSYQENKSALASLQHEKALAAATRIEQYIEQIVKQLAYAALPQLDASDVELRRIEFLKLLRQAPEVTDIAQLDASGREQIAISRLGMDNINSGKDQSQEPAFQNARKGQTWFGPVYFKKETEPYMKMAVRSSDNGPVTIADVNLKFIWDVVSRIKIGEKGKAYVVDVNGFLVADPDIGLVLRKTNLAHLPHVKAATGKPDPDEPAMVSLDPSNVPVLTSVVPIASLRWNVFVEQPVSEVYAKLNASILRTAGLLIAGLVISALAALALARSMVRPIRTLDEGARRIGAGELDQKIEVRTRDELEGLANQFNRMTDRLRDSYAGLEQKVEARTLELQNSLEQQTAISEILRVISSSPTDVKPVLEAVAERAAHLCDAPFARVLLIEGNELRLMTDHSPSEALLRPDQPFPLSRTVLTGRAVLERRTIHHADILPLLDSEYPDSRETNLAINARAVLAVPLVREGGAYGGIFLFRRQPGLFSPNQVALVETFAYQAAIAIDNVRLFNETQESLQTQTATADILKVISRSPTDVQPVFDAIAERAQALCNGIVSAVSRFDGELVHLVAFCGVSADADHAMRSAFPMRPGPRSITGRVVVARAPVQIPDVLQDPDYALKDEARESGYRSNLAVPMLRDGEVIGSIVVCRAEVGMFPEQQIRLLQTFADQAAIAIENVRLFNETKEALEQQTAVAEILRAISASPTDVQPVLDAIAERAARLCDAAAASMYLTDGNVLRHLASKGPSPDPVSSVEVMPVDRESISGCALLERRTIMVEDMREAGSEYPLSAEIARNSGARTVVVVPLTADDEPFGTIVLRRQEVRPFSERELVLLQTFGDQAAIALKNVRLFEEIQEKSRQVEIASQHKMQFLANMSHELRTPLNAILGYAELLVDGIYGALEDRVRGVLDRVQHNGKHLLGLINDVLDLSKIDAGQLQLSLSSYSMAALVKSSIASTESLARNKGLALEAAVAEGLPIGTGDERRLTQVLLNILGNAIKFTDQGKVEVVATVADGKFYVDVSDTGPGIAEADQARIFEEFQQVDLSSTRTKGGTGLGLAIAKRIVEMHGGTITVTSQVGVGSTFRVVVPVQVEQQKETA